MVGESQGSRQRSSLVWRVLQLCLLLPLKTRPQLLRELRPALVEITRLARQLLPPPVALEDYPADRVLFGDHAKDWKQWISCTNGILQK